MRKGESRGGGNDNRETRLHKFERRRGKKKINEVLEKGFPHLFLKESHSGGVEDGGKSCFIGRHLYEQ